MYFRESEGDEHGQGVPVDPVEPNTSCAKVEVSADLGDPSIVDVSVFVLDCMPVSSMG